MDNFINNLKRNLGTFSLFTIFTSLLKYGLILISAVALTTFISVVIVHYELVLILSRILTVIFNIVETIKNIGFF